MKKILLIASCVLVTLNLSAQNTVSQDNKGKVKYQYYENYQGRFVPDFDTLGTPTLVGYTDCIDLEGIPNENSDHYALLLDYTLKVQKEDTYTFRLCSDDGSMLYVDGKLLIDDNGEHGPVFKDADIKLSKGNHILQVHYFEFHKSQSLSLFYKTTSTDFTQVGIEQNHKLPEFVIPQCKETAKRMKAWIGKDEVVIFPILTDIHTCNRETYRHIGYMAEMDKYFNYDFMACLGDIGLNTEPAHSSQEYANQLIDNTLKNMSKYHGVWLYAPGNHDYDGGGDRHITSAELSDMFQKTSLPFANGNLHLTEGNTWCYYDIPEKNVRFILLNSQNGETLNNTYYIYGNEQLQWLISLLNKTPEGYDVMIMDHYMPHNIGRWGSGKRKLDTTSITFMTLLQAYANKTKGNDNNIVWDFTNAKGSLIGLFTGDSHINALIQENGVNYFITQGYGKSETKQTNEGQKRAWYNSRHSLCCDIIVLKPNKNQVHTFRVGAGGADFDYQFNYGTK